MINPKLIKFAVELQTSEKEEKKKKEPEFLSHSLKKIFYCLSPVKVEISQNKSN